MILAALGATYVGSDGNFPGIELRDVLVRGMAVSFVLLLGAWAISFHSRTASNAALTLVTTAGMFTAYIVHTELFYPANRIWLVGFCTAAGIALFAAFRLIDDTRRGGLGLAAAASLPIAALAWQIVSPMLWPGLMGGIDTLSRLLELGSLVTWIALVGVCVGTALALFLWFTAAGHYRWVGAILAAAMALATLLFWPKLLPRVIAGLDTPGGLLDPGSLLLWTALIGMCASTALASYLSFRAADPSRWGAYAGLAAALLVGGTFIWFGNRYGEGGDGYFADGWEGHKNVQAIAFEETPNLYFIGFESISPETVMRKHMGIDTTDFHRVLEGEMRRFRNMFASAAATYNSFLTLMSLDLDIVLEHRDATRSRPSYFAGHDLSPLVWILRENGYETSSLYQTMMFGRTQGPGIDNYKVNNRKRSVACSLLDQDVRRLAFWGYCWNGAENIPALSFGDSLIQEIGGLDRNNPQFVIAHHRLPGHASKLFDPDDLVGREEFFDRYERDFNKAAVYLEQIIDHLRTNDPNAILFVFGDHGPLLSRGLEIEEDPTFVIQDWFGILGGVYPPDRCAAEFDEAESKGYVTSLDIVHAILECLSGGQSPLKEPRNDRFWGPIVPEDHSYKFEDFVYE